MTDQSVRNYFRVLFIYPFISFVSFKDLWLMFLDGINWIDLPNLSVRVYLMFFPSFSYIRDQSVSAV